VPGFNVTRPVAAFLRKKLSLTPEEEAVALYGMQAITYFVTGFLSVAAVGYLLGCLGTTLTVAATAFVLRLFSGGAHSGSPLTCNLIGMVIVPLLGKTAAAAAPFLNPLSLAGVVILGSVPSLLLNRRLAPVDSPAKPITDPEQRRKLRLLSSMAVLVLTAAQLALAFFALIPAVILAASLGLWWQTFSLTGAAHRFAAFMDKSIKKGGEAA
jgi:accessory gene regulator B